MPSRRIILSDPWTPEYMLDMNGFAELSVGTGTLSATANNAIYVPVFFPCDCTVYSLRATGTNTTGNYDLGLYTGSFVKITSKGVTALANALISHTFSDFRVRGGELYYFAMWLSSASGTVLRQPYTATWMNQALGVMSEASLATGLPTTPAAVSATHVVAPAFNFGVR